MPDKSGIMKTMLLFFAGLLLLSCTVKKDQYYQASGTITGYDLTQCACCGGYLMKIDGSDSIYRFYHFPKGTNVDSTQFPVKVKFNYLKTSSCGNYPVITFQSVVKA